MKNRVGSAMLMTLGVISVLLIFILALFNSKRERVFSTRLMSDEKKAEAIAETAVDLTVAYLRKFANSHNPDGNSSGMYYLLRTPLKLKLDRLVTGDGRNIPLETEDLAPLPPFGTSFPALAPLNSLINELGGPDKVDLEIICSIPQAEAFSSADAISGDYEVVGITEKSLPARGISAGFIDSIDDLPSSDGSLQSAPWAPSNWELEVNLPSLTNTDVKKFKVKVLIKKVTVTLTLTKLDKTRIRVKATAAGFTALDKVIDIKDYVKDFFPGIDPLNMHGVRKKMMPGSDAAMSNSYQAQKFQSLAETDFNRISAKFDASKLEKDSYSAAPRIVEKGGLFQIQALVKYRPQGMAGKVIEKKLVAQLPFKVSDVQPIAPEYAFFVANSPLIKENSPRPGADGSPIDLNVADPPGPGPAPIPAAPVGYFIVHNLPSQAATTFPAKIYEANFKNISGFTLNTDEKALIPGMIRVNADGRMKLHTFLGTFDEPELTELNIMCSPYSETNPSINKFQTKPAFQWYGNPVQRLHEVEFPVLFQNDMIYAPVPELGVDGIMKIYKQGGLDLMMVPTLLYGYAHMEYPLGIRPEGPIDMVYGRIVVRVNPRAKLSGLSVKDTTQVYINYNNLSQYSSYSGGGPAKYGMQDFPAYDSDGDYDPDSFRAMPANCYSIIQYSKKATRFYDSSDEFNQALNVPTADGGLKNPDGSIDIDGVVYVKGQLLIDKPLIVKGKGLIVAKTDVILTRNITRSDEKTVFGLIARGGRLDFRSGCSVVEAACFSNDAPVTTSTSQVVINGNLVANAFDRRQIVDLKVFYNSAACSVNPLAVFRDVGKYAPERYRVSFSGNWSKFAYEKK